MRFGVNTWVWTSPLTTDELKTLAPKVKGMGFDWIELPVEGLNDFDYVEAGKIVKDNGLGVSMCAAMGPDRDLIHEDAAIRENGAAYIRQILIGYTRQIALTPALRPVFGDSTQPTPPQVPPRLDATQGAPSFNTQTIAPPPPPIHPPTVLPPSVLPEEDRISLAPPPTQVPDEPLFKTGSIPVFFDSGKRDKGTRRPPVPNLPE